jgi:hypothetical protein
MSRSPDLRSYPANVQMLVRHARDLLREWLPGAEETEDRAARMFAYAYGPGYRGTICTVILSKSGIKLGIFNGALFSDPDNLMRGSGKIHRHVPVRMMDELHQPGLKSLVIAAGTACKERLGTGAFPKDLESDLGNTGLRCK